MKLRLREAKSIEAEYQANWASIPRDAFDAIIALDPKTDITKNNIGDTAKRLLLPKYAAGETAFAENPELTELINTYVNNRGKYNIKNVAQFPSVEVFMNYVKDPENTSVEAQEIVKESKIDKIYKQYYSDIPRDEFDRFIVLDPLTNIEKESIGEYAKQLLLPLLRKSLKGDTGALGDYKYKQITDAINQFEKNKKALSADAQVLSSYNTFAEFYDMAYGGTPSEFLTYLKNHEAMRNGDLRYVGSTVLYDVFEAVTVHGNAIVAGAEKTFGGPGLQTTGGDSGASKDYNENAYGHWCTSAATYWFNKSTYKGADGQNKYYVFIYKPNPKADDRAHNYQLAIAPSGEVVSNATGEEKYGNDRKYAEQLFGEDPGVLRVLGKEKDWAGNIDEVVMYSSADFANYEVNNPEDIEKLVNLKNSALIKKMIQKLTIGPNIKRIPVLAFANCSSLTEVNFSEGLENIGAQAFKNCLNLLTVKFPSSLTYIGGQAFMNCASLTGIVRIPNSVTTIGLNAFKNTRATLYIRKDRPAKSLKIDPMDRQWFMDSVQITNESLDEDMNELDEDLPRDLARAYGSLQTRGNSALDHDVQQGETMKKRRGSEIDFYNSDYEAVDARTAAQRVRENPSSVDHIRAIFNKQLLELDLRNNNKVYPVVMPTGDNILFNRRMIDLGAPDNKITDWVRHKVQSNRGLEAVLGAADKIYWTDEYDHIITQDSEIARKRMDNDESQADLKRPPNWDILSTEQKNNWLRDSNYVPLVKKVRDSGTHSGTGTPLDNVRSIFGNNYVAQELRWHPDLRSRKAALDRYKYLQKTLKKLIANRADYDEDEFELLKDSLEQKVKNAYETFIAINTEAQRIAAHAVTEYDEWAFGVSQRIKDHLASMYEVYEKAAQMDEKLRKLKNDLAKEETKTVQDSEARKAYEKQLADKRSRLEDCQASIESVQENINDLEERMRELQAEIDAQRHALDLRQSRKAILTQQLQDMQNEADAIAEDGVKENAEKVNDIEAQILEIQNWFNTTKGSGKRFAVKKHKEENPDVANLFADEEEANEESEDRLDLSPEQIVFVKKICKDLQDLVEEGRGDDIIPFVENLADINHVTMPTNRVTGVITANPFWNEINDVEIDLEDAHRTYENVDAWLKFIWDHHTELKSEIAAVQRN